MSDISSSPPRESIGRRFSVHLLRMPGWHRKILLLAIVLAVGGTIGQMAGYFRSAPAAASSGTSGVPSGSRALDTGGDPAAKTTSDQSSPLWQRLSPSAKRIGISLLIGFILGWIFRAFLKTMAMITILVVGLLALLSYFNMLNFDLSSARQHYDSVAQWLTDQATKLKDVIIAHIPSGASGAFGAFLGARRR